MKRNPFLLIIPIFAFLVFIVQCKKEDLVIIDEEPPIVIEDTVPPPPPPPPVNPLLFTNTELDLINSGSATEAFTIMNYWLQPDSLILRTPSTEISLDEDNYENLQLLADRMKVAMIGANGIGIAAPQIGINRRIFWVQRFDRGIITPYEVYFNPRIISFSGTNVQRQDGCLSVPRGAQWPTSNTFSFRYPTIEVEYYLIDGTKVTETITDPTTSHVFQHELDHLDGVMFMDRNTQW